MFRVRWRCLAHHIEVLWQGRIRKEEARQNRGGEDSSVAAEAAAFALIGIHGAVPGMRSRRIGAVLPVMRRVRFIMRGVGSGLADVSLGAAMRLRQRARIGLNHRAQP